MTTLSHSTNPQESSFTCNTCGIRFVAAELQRQHMKTEWHRYNLKRRVAQLPSIASEVFAEKVLSQKQFLEEGGAEENEDEYGFYVHHRKSSGNKQLTKKFMKRQARQAELPEEISTGIKSTDPVSIVRSSSPAPSVASEFSQFSLSNSTDYESGLETGSELNYTESEDDPMNLDDEAVSSLESESETESIEDLQAIPITHCFYCGVNNKEKELNIKHMFSKHGLYIPERSYLSDLDGLLFFLSEIISLDLECMVCGFLGKSLQSIRQHLNSKGHCTIPYETKEEKLLISEFYNFNVDDVTQKKSNKKVAFSEEVASDDVNDDENGINDNYTLVHIDKSGVELTLPTGSKIGHRSMARYYRQNIVLAREISENEKTVALVDRRFSPGLTTNEITKQEKETRRIEQKLRNNYERKTKPRRVNFQKHFVDEMLGPN